MAATRPSVLAEGASVAFGASHKERTVASILVPASTESTLVVEAFGATRPLAERSMVWKP
jgi:hypothetical protein